MSDVTIMLDGCYSTQVLHVKALSYKVLCKLDPAFNVHRSLDRFLLSNLGNIEHQNRY